MKVLALETSSSKGSLCLARMAENSAAEILDQRSWQKKSSHSDVVTLMIQAALKDAGWTLKDLDVLCVDVGPGSFTGIRVGLNVIRSFAYGLNLKIRPFSSLELLAFAHLKDGQRGWVCLPAVQNYLYAAGFGKNGGALTCFNEPESLTEEALSRMKDEKSVMIRGDSVFPEASTMVEMLDLERLNLKLFAWKSVKPLYIRRSEAEEKLHRGLLKPLATERKSEQ